MSKKTYIVGFLLALFVGLCYYWFGGSPLPQPLQRAADANMMKYNGSSIVEEENGQKKWEFTADSIVVDQETNNILLKNVRGVFYQADGSQVIMTAQSGNVDGKTRDAAVEGDVHIATASGAVMDAPRIAWQSATRRFVADRGVKVIKDDTVLTGDRMESDEQLELIKTIGHARVQKGGITQ